MGIGISGTGILKQTVGIWSNIDSTVFCHQF